MQDRIRLYPHEFSGGMRQRVLIAIGLASRPSLLIADEPTSALDVTVQKTILDNLSWLTESLGTALLFITHDLGLAAERAKHLIVMYKGRIVEQGDAIEILKNPKHPYTKRLVATAPGLHSERLVSDKVGITRERSEELRSEESPSSLATSGGPSTELGNNDAIISVQNLTKIFETHRLGKKIPFTAVDNVSFDVKKGTTLGIVGESGSGKSTVANMVLKLLDPTSGEIIIQGKDISHITHRETLKFRRNVQPIFQNPYGSLDPMYSIYRAIMEPLNIHKIGNRKYRDKRTRELLDYVQLPQSILGRYPNELSGGQRQRIAVARALALEPEILVCDEAVSALDVLVQDQVLRLINDLQAELGLTYLFITHDLGVIKQIADDVIVMEHGKVVESRKTMELFQNPEKAYTRELLDAIPGSKLGIGIS
jgi:peptide/nickel transport system ATP-binding protein